MYTRYIRWAFPVFVLLLWPAVAFCQSITPANNRALAEQVTSIQVDSTHSDSLVPRTALLRSTFLPGWGQLYNGKPYKAAFFATVSAGLLASVISEQAALGNAQTPLESEDRAARRNTRILFFALSVTFAGLDAYIDAHLADFNSSWSTQVRADGALLTLHVDLPP